MGRVLPKQLRDQLRQVPRVRRRGRVPELQAQSHTELRTTGREDGAVPAVPQNDC